MEALLLPRTLPGVSPAPLPPSCETLSSAPLSFQARACRSVLQTVLAVQRLLPPFCRGPVLTSSSISAPSLHLSALEGVVPRPQLGHQGPAMLAPGTQRE